MSSSSRSDLFFAMEASRAFEFLVDLGFTELEASPALVRYRKGGVEVDVYHGRQSYEIGAVVTAFGNRYALSEIIRHADFEAGSNFRYPATTTKEGVVSGLNELSFLMRRYGISALDGDPKIFSMLDSERTSWSEEYALDVLADQLRSQADDAFRRGNYEKSAELYSRIRGRLSPAELKKLSIAEERGKD